jgi:putative ABC transport system permease protein
VLIAGFIDEAFGLQAYARADWMASVLGEAPRVSTVLVRVDPAFGSDVRARLRQLPAVIGVAETSHVIERYREEMGKVIVWMTLILAISAAAIATGVVYNNARIALSMRERDLASLRVLGFTRGEISTMLLGELAAQVVLGIPLGFLVGTWWSKALAAQIDPEAIRFSLHIADHTYVIAAVIALASGLASALLVRSKLDHLDLVAVLKSSE